MIIVYPLPFIWQAKQQKTLMSLLTDADLWVSSWNGQRIEAHPILFGIVAP